MLLRIRRNQITERHSAGQSFRRQLLQTTQTGGLSSEGKHRRRISCRLVNTLAWLANTIRRSPHSNAMSHHNTEYTVICNMLLYEQDIMSRSYNCSLQNDVRKSEKYNKHVLVRPSNKIYLKNENQHCISLQTGNAVTKTFPQHSSLNIDRR